MASKRLRMEGFLILDYLHQINDVLATMEKWLLDGKLINKNHIIHGLENAPDGLAKLMSGGNIGKLVVYVE
mgnify:FL=1